MEPSYKQKIIFNIVFVRHLEFENFWFFCHVSVAWDKICVCVLSIVKFGQFAAEIWRYNDFQNGGRPPSWIFQIWRFHHLTVVHVFYASSFQISSQSDHMEPSYDQKMIVNMASVRHLEFGNSLIFLTFPSIGSKFASAYQNSSYSYDSRLRYGAITIFKMAAVRHIGFSKFDIFIS